MESIGYVAIYFLKGYLPWQGLKAFDKVGKYNRIKQKKLEFTSEELCKGLPSAFAKYLNEVKNLRFDEKPDYDKFKKMFKNLFFQNAYKFDYEYDWVSAKNKVKKE